MVPCMVPSGCGRTSHRAQKCLFLCWCFLRKKKCYTFRRFWGHGVCHRSRHWWTASFCMQLMDYQHSWKCLYLPLVTAHCRRKKNKSFYNFFGVLYVVIQKILISIIQTLNTGIMKIKDALWLHSWYACPFSRII